MPELRLLCHVVPSTVLCQGVALVLVGANCLPLESDGLPTIQNSAAKGAKRHLVDLCGPASSPFSMLYHFLPGYQGIFGSQPVSSLSGAILIESFLQNHKTQAPASFTYPPTLTPDLLNIFNVALKPAGSERSLVAMGTVTLPCSQHSPL